MRIGLVSLGRGVPIGLVYLGTYLKKHKVDVRIIDSNFQDVYAEVMCGDFDLIGISAMTVYYGDAIRLARHLKQLGVPVIIGGVHISTLPSSFEDCFDGAVLGEGEEVLLQIAEGGNYKGLLQGKPIENLDDLPLPDWSLVDKRYFAHTPSTTFGEFGVGGNILTSRGCPYKCLFCSTTQFWGKLRFHSAEYVVDMLEDLITHYHANLIQIWDDLFTINLPRIEKIRELLVRRGLASKRIKYNCQPRANLVNDELCRLLKEVGVTMGIFGFESGSDKVLGYLKNDTVTVYENMKAIDCFHRNGLKVQGSVVLGSPTETIGDMYCTLQFVDFCIRMGVERLWVFVLTPFPGTVMWSIAKQRGRVRDANFDWDSLTCHNVDKPLLLDDYEFFWAFQRVYELIQRKVRGQRWNKVRSFLLHNPIQSIMYFIRHSHRVIDLLMRKEDV